MKNIFSKFFKKETEQPEKETDKVISACISLMIEVSMADQSIDDEEIESLKKTLSEKFDVEGSEIETLKNVLVEKFDVEETDLENLISDAKKNQNSSTSLYEFTRKINDEYEFDDKKNLILSMWKIAYADGNIDKYEEYVIRKVSDLIYISHPDFIESKQKARGEYENRKT